MKQVFFGHVLIAATIIMLLPCIVQAQDDEMSFSADEVEETPSESEEETDTTGLGSDAEGSSVLDEFTNDLTADISIEGEEGPKLPEEEAKDGHEVWAVQPIYALKEGKFDFQPSFGISMNDPYVQHMAITLAASYYLTEVLAVGLSFNWYRGLDVQTDLNFQLERSTHQAVPLNEYLLGGQLNFMYVPIYGKFAMFKQWIVHWDVWVIGGGGMIMTRPIPNIDPEYRTFDWGNRFCFNVGLGGRLFLRRYLAIYVEVRDYIFPEALEALTAPTSVADREDESQWTEKNRALTNNVMLHAGVSIFFPFAVEYELPK